MADQNRNNQTVTWNSGGTAFDGYKLNVTDTASAAASLLQNFQVGGAVKFSVRKDGLISTANGITPITNDVGALGASAVGFSDAFFASGAVIGFNTSAYTITHSAGLLTFSHNISATSDERLKENIFDIGDALALTRQLRGAYFTRKDDETGRRQIGVIAQEVEAVVPELVDSSGEFKSVMYGNGLGLLIEAIKEMADTIDRQENRIRTLEAR